MIKKVLGLIFAVMCFASLAQAQQAQVTISLDEQFFDALLDAMLNNSSLEFPIAQNPKSKLRSLHPDEKSFEKVYFNETIPKTESSKSFCDEKIVLRRESGVVRTAVRFRDGKIYAPIAFSGSYNPPLVGCIDFSGYAETNIDLEFDQNAQTLYGRARVLNVQLNGAPGVAGNLMARLVQNSIDGKINPIEILKTDKVSFVIPIQNNGSLQMKAVGISHDIGQGVLNVRVAYEFQKSN